MLADLLAALADGSIEIVDLTQPLSERTPVIRVPEPFLNTPGLTMRELSHYDEKGPRWRWNTLELGEHVGTHVDAPMHWITGRSGADVASIPVRQLIGPAVVVDRSKQAQENPDYLLTLDELRAIEADDGPMPDGGWLLLRTGWSARVDDPVEFLNNASGRPRTPGIAPEAARWIAQETGLVGVGVETVGTDAGASPTFDPPTPVHHYLLGAGKVGLTQLTNLDRLPKRGAVIVVAPLRLVNGTGSPCRALAFVPRQTSGPSR